LDDGGRQRQGAITSGEGYTMAFAELASMFARLQCSMEIGGLLSSFVFLGFVPRLGSVVFSHLRCIPCFVLCFGVVVTS
jgi:hypothetical protein